MNDKFVTAGIWITRRCNFRCPYCNIPKTDFKELGINEWTKAVDIIKKLGIKKVVLLGGEVTLYKNLVEIVDYIINNSKLECSLTTNAFKNYEIIKSLIKTGLKNISVSVDTLDISNSMSPIKTESSLELIKKLEKDKLKGIINLKCYTLVNKSNIKKLEDFIKYMTNRGIKVYLIPYHWGDEEHFEHRKSGDKFAFVTDEDVKLYKKVIDKIIKLKREGYLIVNSEEYLLTTKEHIKKLNWKCNGLSELRIDSDGSLLCCCDKKGEVNKKFSIFDLNNETKIKKFLEIRAKDSNSCAGCLWPSSFESERMKNNNLDTPYYSQ
jgi:molybdenum cofactor biosynthesis enzyme MoaA